jgi:hypothetical protein
VIKRFAALLVLFSVSAVTIVHACSGLDGMQMVVLHNASPNDASHDGMMAGQPCVQRKQADDPCKSVRYRMLSIQAEPAQNSLTLLPATLPNAISVEDLLPLTPLLAAPPGAAPVYSLSRHSPRFSHIVLRI